MCYCNLWGSQCNAVADTDTLLPPLLLQVMFYQAQVPLGAVAEGFLKPSIPRPAIGQAVALVGSLIMPHNIYLHSALVQVRLQQLQQLLLLS
jgi:Mn2+/Fe2+ NRAMP family transporter